MKKDREPNGQFAKGNTLGGVGAGRKIERTYEKLRKTCDDFIDWARNGIPYKDKNGYEKRSAVYFKKKLAIYKDFSWFAFIEAIRYFEANNTDENGKPISEFSVALSEIDEIIENRLFEAGLSKKSDASIVRLGLSANYGWTTDRVKNELTGKDGKDLFGEIKINVVEKK